MAKKNYINLNNLSTFLNQLKQTFSEKEHEHNVSDLKDYVVDTSLSETSVNPVQNKVIYAEFDEVAQAMGALDLAIDGKSDIEHDHDDIYYTESEINIKLASKSDTTHKHDDAYDVKGAAEAVQKNLDAASDEFDDHKDNSNIHVTDTERTNWNAAKTHADSEHAPSNAEKNQNAFSNIVVSGQTTVAADTTTDTITFVGTNMTITTDATNNKVTFAVTDGSTSEKGVVQLTDSTSSTSTTTAATPSSVKSAYDLANNAKTNAANAQAKADEAFDLADIAASAVHVGPDMPTDPNVKVWINTAEEGTGVVPMIPRVATITLAANAWIGNANPYSQVVSVPTVTSSTKIDLQPTAQQIVELNNEDIALIAQNDGGNVTIYALGGKPSANYTMQVLLTEVAYV